MQKIDCNQNIYNAFTSGASLAPKEPALIYLGKKFSYKTVLGKVEKLKKALGGFKIARGEVVITTLANIPSAAYLIYAIAGAGGVAYPAHALSTPEQVEKMIKNTGARLIFSLSTMAKSYIKVCEKHGVTLVSVSPANELSPIKRAVYNTVNRPHKSLMSYNKFIKKYVEQGSNMNATPLAPDKTVVLLNSGGTSGEAKVVELSSLAINMLGKDAPKILCQDSVINKKMMSPLPFFHGFGLAMGLHSFFCNGGCNVLIPRFRRKYAMRYIKRGQIDYMIGVPAVYGAILSHKRFYGRVLKKLKCAFVGGDFVPQSLLDSFNSRMQQINSECKLFEGYGLTETVSVAAVNTLAANKKGSVGKCVDGANIRAFNVENSLNPLPFMEQGELYISGETLMNGYYKDEKATKNTFFVDKEGTKWLRTGDYGYVDEDNYVFFRQRLKRIIKVSGISVFPSQIEQAASKHSKVGQVCAFAIDDKKKGSVVVLAVEASESFDEIKSQLQEILCREIDVEARPKDIFFVDRFPLTAMNKIDYNALKELYLSRINFSNIGQ